MGNSSRPLALLCLAAWAVALLAAAVPTDAQGNTIGVAPGTLPFTNPPVLPGSSNQGTFHFSNSYADPVNGTFTVGALDAPTRDWDDASQWVTIDRPARVTMPVTNDYPVLVTLQVPTTAANGQYKAQVTFSPDKPEGSGVSVLLGAVGTINITVNNADSVLRVEVLGSPSVFDAELDGPLQATVSLKNTGNVDAQPRVRVNVLDRFQDGVVARYWVNDTVLSPGQTLDKTLIIEPHRLPLDQYWAVLEIYLAGEIIHTSGAKTFDVLEAGTLSRAAELRTIQVSGNSAFARVGDLLKLSAIVRNTGQVPLVAQFKGEVLFDGSLLELIESRELEVPIDVQLPLDMFYTPDKAGRYEFVGRAYYGPKVTEEKSIIITVTGSSGFDVPWLWVGAALAVLLAVLIGLGMRKRGKREDPAGQSGSLRGGPRRGGRPGPGRRPPPGATRSPSQGRAGPRRVPSDGAGRPPGRRPAGPGGRPPPPPGR